MTKPTQSLNADCKPSLSAPESEIHREIFCGIPVHPFASQFPLITGTEFDELVSSIREMGTLTPAETHNGELIDGRNRARAVEVLQQQGLEIELPTAEWQPHGPETVEEHIYALNVHRRHLTDDQRAAFATTMLPAIRAAREARQAKTRFSGQNSATTKTESPENPEAQPRSSREKASSTSVGHLAKLASVSHHKAAQAVALADGVAAGEIPRADLEAVQHGDKRLRDIAAIKRSRRSSKPSSRVEADASEFWDEWAEESDEGGCDASLDEYGDDCSDDGAKPVRAPECTEEEVRRRWERFKQPFAVADYPELRRLTIKIIAAEEASVTRGS
jgi:ParB-like chromosome segregation protein Spo0J